MDINDPVFLRRYRMYEDGRRDADSRVAAAAAAAAAAAENRKAVEIAINLKNLNVPIDVIIQSTGLTEKEIKAL